MKTKQAIVHLSRDRLGAHEIVEKPSFPKRPDDGIEDGKVVWTLAARLIDRNERVFNVQALELKVSRMSRVAEVFWEQGL